MCESNVFVKRGEKEEIFLRDVGFLKPEGEFIHLRSIFGEEKKIKAHIKEIDLMGHRILLDTEDG